MNLYFFHSNVCAACKIAEPELNRVQSQRHDLNVIRRVIDVSDDGRDVVEGFKPRMTPAYAVTSGGELISTHQGLLKKGQLEKFLDSAGEEIKARGFEAIAGVRTSHKAKAYKPGAKEK